MERSLWDQITLHTNPSELEEITYVVGEALVEKVQSIHREVVSLLAILQDYRQGTDKCEQTVKPNPDHQSLPEPPELRNSLVKEIQFLANGLEGKGKIVRSAENTITYALKDNTQTIGQHTEDRPKTAERPSTASVKRRLNKVSEIQNAVRINEINSVVHHIREALELEYEALLQDVDFIQKCLLEEHDYRHSLASSSREKIPSIHELRLCRSALEKEYLSSSILQPTLNISPSHANLSRAPGRLKPISAVNPESSRGKSIHKPCPPPPMPQPPPICSPRKVSARRLKR
eukprot:m.52650 g.52650  ORF g.52650 m.52650 type:complete len:289 (+) comp10808_c0_seq4:354-1220(+)